VLVRHELAAPPLDEAAVRSLVARAVEAMRPEDVAVVFVRRVARPRPAAVTATTLGIQVVASDAGRVRSVVVVTVVLAAIAAGLATREVLRLRRRDRA